MPHCIRTLSAINDSITGSVIFRDGHFSELSIVVYTFLNGNFIDLAPP